MGGRLFGSFKTLCLLSGVLLVPRDTDSDAAWEKSADGKRSCQHTPYVGSLWFPCLVTRGTCVKTLLLLIFISRCCLCSLCRKLIAQEIIVLSKVEDAEARSLVIGTL